MKKSLIMIMIAIVALMVSCEPSHVDDLPHSITWRGQTDKRISRIRYACMDQCWGQYWTSEQCPGRLLWYWCEKIVHRLMVKSRFWALWREDWLYEIVLMTHEKCTLPGIPAVCKGAKAVLWSIEEELRFQSFSFPFYWFCFHAAVSRILQRITLRIQVQGTWSVITPLRIR